MKYLKIAHWKRWQSYRADRGQPPWIKLHRLLMRNPEWIGLTDAQRGQLVSIWLLAADKMGKIPDDPELIRQICFMTKKPDLELYISLEFIEKRRQGDAKVTPTRRQGDASETEKRRVEKSRVDPPNPPRGKSVGPDFEIFDHWNKMENLVTHRELTPDTKTAIRNRRKKGYSPAMIRLAITNYDKLCGNGHAPGYCRWTLLELMKSVKYFDPLLSEDWEGFVGGLEKRPNWMASEPTWPSREES